MGYNSTSRRLKSFDDASNVRAVLEHSLSVSELSRDDPVASPRSVRSLWRAMHLDGSSSSDVTGSCHRSLHEQVMHKSTSNPEDLLPALRLVKTPSLESVSSTSSGATPCEGMVAPPASPGRSPGRSIFSRYWDLKKEKKIDLRPQQWASSKSQCDSDKNEVHVPGKDLALDEKPSLQSSAPVPSSPSQRNRRSIFGHASSSHDLIPQRNVLPIQRASSTSVLLSKRRSCLRSVQRYSLSSADSILSSSLDSSLSDKLAGVRRVRSSSTVSFSAEVDVMVFEKAFEVHAEEGWSDQFH